MKDLIPKRRFAGFTEAWERRRLGEIADIVGGGTPSTNNPEYWDGDIDWYAPAEMEGQRYAVGSVKKITELGLQKSSATMLPAGRTVLFTSRAGIGKMAILQRSAVTNQGFQSIVLKDEYSPYFIYSMGSKIKELAEGVASGSTFLEISGKMLANLIIAVPSMAEQNKIANYFQRIDDLITLHQRKLGKLQDLKSAYLYEMFPQEGELLPKRRFAGFTEPWERRKLGEITRFSKGKGYSRNDLTEKGTPIILYGSLYTNYQTVISEVTTFAVDKINSVYSLGNEVVVPSSGESADDIARASVVVNKGVILGGDLNIIHPNNSIAPIFLALLISHGDRKIELAKKAQGKSVVHLYNTDLEEVSVIYPTWDEQTRISDFFANLDNLIALHQRKLEKLKALKKAYLNEMFV